MKATTLILSFFFSFTLLAQMGLHIGQGVTDPGDWVDYDLGDRDFDGVYIDINTSDCGFRNTPHYLVTLESVGEGPRMGSGKWETSGYTAIYNATPTGFRVYARWTDGEIFRNSPTPFTRTLTAQQAEDFGYVIRWTGIATGNPDGCNTDGDESTSTNEINSANYDFGVFPNPANSQLNIRGSAQLSDVKIYNAQGALVGTYPAAPSININDLAAGTYIVWGLFTDGKIITTQFVKN